MRTHAVVLGGGVNSLGVIRSLGREQVPTIVLGDNRWQPAMHSRYARPVMSAFIDGQGLIDTLIDVAHRCGERPVLFPTSDVQVATLSERRAELAGLYRLRLPAHQIVCDLLHKAAFQALAEQHGFPVPRSVVLAGDADLDALGTLEYPVILKPGLQRYIADCHMSRNYIAVTREAADWIARRLLRNVHDLVVQEWIDGDDDDLFFCLQYRGTDGVVSSFTGRKLRCWPPHRGSTASCIPAPAESGKLEALTSAFFSAVQFVGMGSMEFKRDRRTGRFLMIEPTVGRTDWQEEIATLNGVNIPAAAYRYELGLPQVPARRPPRPVVWRDSLPYVQSVLKTGRTRRQSEDERVARQVGVAWRRDDPWPAAYFALAWLQKLPRRSGWKATFGDTTTRNSVRATPLG